MSYVHLTISLKQLFCKICCCFNNLLPWLLQLSLGWSAYRADRSTWEGSEQCSTACSIGEPPIEQAVLHCSEPSQVDLWSWFAWVNALCNLSRKKSQEVTVSFPGQFWIGVASHCVSQWKLNLELWSSTNATTVVVAKITRERAWRVEKKCLCVIFWLIRRSRVHGTKMRFGASYSMSKLLLVARHILTMGL